MGPRGEERADPVTRIAGVEAAPSEHLRDWNDAPTDPAAGDAAAR